MTSFTPSLRTVPPSFQNQTLNISAVPSQSVTLPCATFPDPTLSFSWMFGGVPLRPDSSEGGLRLLADGSLVLSSPQGRDEGVYTCTASNNLGSASGLVYLNVLGKWRVHKGHQFRGVL